MNTKRIEADFAMKQFHAALRALGPLRRDSVGESEVSGMSAYLKTPQLSTNELGEIEPDREEADMK